MPRKMTNQQVRDLFMALNAMGSLTGTPEMPQNQRAAYRVVAFRVGHALRVLQPLLETFAEMEGKVAQDHARKIDGRPVVALDDDGRPTGIELENQWAFGQALKPLLRETVEVPDFTPLDYDLLEAAGIDVDGHLAMRLGDFLTGEPRWTPDLKLEVTGGD
jgi:hypothetical protein